MSLHQQHGTMCRFCAAEYQVARVHLQTLSIPLKVGCEPDSKRTLSRAAHRHLQIGAELTACGGKPVGFCAVIEAALCLCEKLPGVLTPPGLRGSLGHAVDR
jgi:hypothetical protein